MKLINTHWSDAEELAAAILGCEEWDNDEIEAGLIERFDIGFEQFHGVVNALLPMTPTFRGALTGKEYHAFIYKGAAIIKHEADDETD